MPTYDKTSKIDTIQNSLVDTIPREISSLKDEEETCSKKSTSLKEFFIFKKFKPACLSFVSQA